MTHGGEDAALQVATNGSRGDVALASAAASGQEDAWRALVERFAGHVWAAARRGHASEQTASEVFRVTWMRLVDNLHVMPIESIESWLSETAERERTRVLSLYRGT